MKEGAFEIPISEFESLNIFELSEKLKMSVGSENFRISSITKSESKNDYIIIVTIP